MYSPYHTNQKRLVLAVSLTERLRDLTVKLARSSDITREDREGLLRAIQNMDAFLSEFKGKDLLLSKGVNE